MNHETCQSCKAFGAERVGHKGQFYGSCRARAPLISSTWIGTGDYGDAWVGQWPFVRYDDWCLLYVSGGDRTATIVKLGTPTLED